MTSVNHSHTCHAVGCKTTIPPEMLMCRRHWFMVPKTLRDRVWSTYRQGQCDDWNPSAEYCQAAKSAVIAVAKAEGREINDKTPEIALYDMFSSTAPTPMETPKL